MTPFYDSLLAKVIARGGSREEAADKMAAALSEIRIEGVVTNLEFLTRCINHSAFRAGETTTDFVNLHRADLI